MQVELKKLQHDVGITFLCVTHDQEEALAMSDRVAVIDHGRIEQVGTPQEIYERPATPFVASFIGETNLIEGVVESSDEIPARISNGKIGFLIRLPRPIPAGSRITVSLRPEKVAVRPDPRKVSNIFQATVRGEVYLGSLLRFEVELEGGQVLWVARQLQFEEDYLRPGENVTVGWGPESRTLVEGVPP